MVRFLAVASLWLIILAASSFAYDIIYCGEDAQGNIYLSDKALSDPRITKTEIKRGKARFENNESAPQPPAPPPESPGAASGKFGVLEKIFDASNAWTLISKATEKGDHLKFQMSDKFHREAYQNRLQFCQSLYKMVSKIYGEAIFVSFTDGMGNEVGGYSIFSGVWVQEK